jgi:hypothetical protein
MNRRGHRQRAPEDALFHAMFAAARREAGRPDGVTSCVLSALS